MAILSINSVLPPVKDNELEFVKYSNLLAVLISRRERWKFVPGKPLEVTIDTTTACNLSCPYCGTGRKTLQRPAANLQPELHRQMMNFFGREAFISWYFSNGEPLLNKRLPELMQLAAEREVFSVISTNLSVPVGKDRLKALVGSGLNFISASIDGVTQKTYSRYRVGGNFELVIQNLKDLVELKRRSGSKYPIIEWRFLVFEHNQHELADILSAAQEIGVDLVEFFYGNAPLQTQGDQVRRSTLTKLPVAAVSGPLIDELGQRRDTFLRRRLSGKRVTRSAFTPDSKLYKCDWLYMGGMYYADGHVGPCCVVGNQKTDFGSLEDAPGYQEIWNGAKYRSARNHFKDSKAPAVWTVCSRCPLPAAQTQMFKHTLQAYLLNAPEWFIGIVAAEPEQFFHPYDFELLPQETTEIRAMGLSRPTVPDEIVRRLEAHFAARPRVLAKIRSINHQNPSSGSTATTP
jgi:MoaA/NifB/PqqE/SkfB family radical SAM enzyme